MNLDPDALATRLYVIIDELLIDHPDSRLERGPSPHRWASAVSVTNRMMPSTSRPRGNIVRRVTPS